MLIDLYVIFFARHKKCFCFLTLSEIIININSACWFATSEGDERKREQRVFMADRKKFCMFYASLFTISRKICLLFRPILCI